MKLDFSKAMIKMAGVRFVNLSHPDDLKKNKTTMLAEIRRHVMRGIGESRRRQRPELDCQITLDFHDFEITASSTKPEETKEPPPKPSPVLVGQQLQNSLVPLGFFPIEANPRVLELVNFGKLWFVGDDKDVY